LIEEVGVKDLVKSLQNISKICVLKEEDFVIRSLLRGVSQKKIIDTLKEKYPEESITKRDLDEFMYLYKDVLHNEIQKTKSSYGRRLMKQQEGLTNELIDLAVKTKLLVDKFQEEGDNTNTVGALRVAADIFMKVGKVQGIFNDGPEINVNMKMDKIVSEITSNDSEFKRKIRNIVNEADEEIIDVEVKDE